MGLAVATRFGKEGYNVGLVARREENLETLKSQLAEVGVTSVKTVTGDVTDEGQLKAALDVIRSEFGSIDVVEYSPALGPQNYRGALDTTYDNARAPFDLIVGGAIKAVNLVVEEMVSKGDGGLLFVAGGSAMKPIPPLANIGIATSGLRNYLSNLHGALAAKGVYVGAIFVSGLIRRGTEVDPDEIADKLFNMFTARDKAEDSVTGPIPPPPGGAGGPPPKP